MNVLLLTGLSIFIGTLGGRICQKFKIPQVTGYIVIGFFLGKTFLDLWSPQMIDQFLPIVNLALGIIGFLIAEELKADLFKNRGKSIYTMLFSTVFLTFIIVTAVVTVFTKQWYLGILLGALASATAPAATVDVLWEYKTKGPLTSMLMAIVALDDVLALIIYGFASVFAKSLLSHEHFSLYHSIGAPFIEIGMAVAIGVLGGGILYWIIHCVKDRERVLPYSIGVLVLTIGLANLLKIDLILASMLVGTTLVNLAPQESKEIFDAVKKFSPPIYVLFFILVGARLDVSLFFGTGIAMLAFLFVVSRTIGKWGGAVLGGILGGAPKSVTKYLGLCLFSQAGVTIGMAISIYNNLSHISTEAGQVGLMIVNVIVATTFIIQLVGPSCIRYAVHKAKEVGRDITEEDIIEEFTVSDLIEKNVPTIKEDTPLYTLVDKVRESDSYHFCVVDKKNRLLGIIAIGDLRDVLLHEEMELDRLILAKDIAVPAIRIVSADTPLKKAIDIFKRKALDVLPIVKDAKTKELVGIIHYQYVMGEVHKELIARTELKES